MLNLRRIQQMVFLISIALLSMGCSDESSVGTEVNTESGGESAVGSEIAGDEGPVYPEPKTAEDFGSPCASNDDCESGFCVEGPDGFICTQPCLEVCPEGFTCKAVSNYYPDVIFLCIPNSDNHCTPCSEDLQCDGGTCALLSEGSFCLTSCNGDDDCEVGNSCATTGDLEGSCVPTNASCTCIEDGLERSCEEENGTGVCNGIQTCDLDTGWSPCSATPATDEICDYQDNDCDGVVDNGFIGENGYDSQEHCGACNLNCNAVFPNAITTCNGELDTPLCVLVACEAGYSLLGDTQCVPSNVGLCEPCTTDENCVLDGSVCMDVGGASFCGTPCQTTTDCPTGFACKTVEPGIPQCYPNGESCTCTEDTPDLVKSCSVTWPGTPVTTCYGQQGCGTDGQWEECDLPEEVCDNQDNNCDGIVDEGFKDEETGQYLSIDNCGQCGNSCAFNSFENGEPVCDATLAVPNCAMACFEGFYDVNSNPNDGCECQWASDTDFPDVNGSDVNCDGIDGEVDNGVFVSKDGDDGNPGTLTLPVRTIQKAITIAFSQEKRDVYVATGIYQEAVFLSDNVHVYGGYRGDFLERDANLYESAILGPPPTTETPGAVHGVQVGVNGSCTFDGFSILGGDAFLPGESSMGIYLLNAGGGLTISNNVIFGGNGANGTNGSNGASGASGTDGTSGVAGKNAGSSTCGAGDEALGGGGGSLSCGGVSTSGGNGGKRICPDAPSDVQNTDQISLSAEYGSSGGNNGISGGGGGFAGFDSLVGYTSCSVCSSNKTWQTDGYDGGEGTQGENGSGGSAVSALNGNFTAEGRWEGPQSASGFDGTAGGGGGGGGAGGGVDISVNCTTGTPAVGGSGGGGGSGGCPGISGASGGPGGSSFGIFAWWGSTPDSYPQFTQNIITRGSGGQGGNGGAGGVGGGGGAGGAGGISGQGTGTFPVVYCGASGGYGGNGGNGGNGGGGAGGAGGLSFGAFMGGSAPTSNVLDSNSFAGGGAPGGGGVGGASYGNSGADGLTGNAGDSNL